MRKQRLSASDGEGFLRAFTDSWSDIEDNYKVRIVCTLRITHRKGVVAVELTATEATETPERHQVARYQVEYPTAAVQTFEAALYQATIKLERVLMTAFDFPMGRA